MHGKKKEESEREEGKERTAMIVLNENGWKSVRVFALERSWSYSV